MAKSTEGIRKNTTINHERKYIRMQEIGLAQLLVLPFVPFLASLIGLQTGGFLIFIALAITGYCCLAYGDEKRRELKHHKNETDCPK